MLMSVRVVKETNAFARRCPEPRTFFCRMVNGAGAGSVNRNSKSDSIEPEGGGVPHQMRKAQAMTVLDPKTGQIVVIDTKPRP